MSTPENPSLYELHPMASGKREYYQSKVTLLDLFAGMAMHGLVEPAMVNMEGGDERYAFRAYEIAQAMLKERERITKGETT